MLICKDGCGAENSDTASQCQRCGRSLRSALRLHNPGTLVRHYRIKRVIGWGGFGAVYEAEDTREPGSRVALKESFDPSGVTSFQGEFAALQQHQHPHLPRYEAMFVDQGNGYLVMEFIPGQSLEDVIDSEPGPMPEEQALGFALQLCKVLTYLHQQSPPILHRDLKPANVRLTPNGRIKLVDFGLFKQGNDTTKSSRMGLTPAYAPVEQHPLAPGHTDQRSDLYSLGATLYHLLTGKLPISSFDRIQTQPDPLVPPQRLNPQISPHLAAAISKAMSLKPDERYPDIAAFQQALLGQQAQAQARQQAQPQAQPQAPPRPKQPPAPAGKRSASPLAIIGGVILVAFMLIGGLSLLGNTVTLVETTTDPLSVQVPEMVPVPAGAFLMGSTDADPLANDNEKPQHTVTLPEYWIGKTEVTNAQFRPFVEGDGYTNQAYWTEEGWVWRSVSGIRQPEYWDDSRFNDADQPVIGVSWYEAVAYVRWLSAQTGHAFHLPTEAQWEKAARGTDGQIYPWGNAWDSDRLNSGQPFDSYKLLPVGQYSSGASPYGAMDMAGNVWEWCATKWIKDYPYRVENEWTEAYLAGTGNVSRVLRGGAWWTDQNAVRGASRDDDDARLRYNRSGLRVASYAPLP